MHPSKVASQMEITGVATLCQWDYYILVIYEDHCGNKP
jgi:hypothetical protein